MKYSGSTKLIVLPDLLCYLRQHFSRSSFINTKGAPQLPLYSSEEPDVLGFLIQGKGLASVGECMFSMSQALGSIPNIKIKLQKTCLA